MKYNGTPGLLAKLIEVFPPVGEFIIVERTYSDGIIDVCDHVMMVDLMEMEMKDF